jgi:hypothetical protein
MSERSGVCSREGGLARSFWNSSVLRRYERVRCGVEELVVSKSDTL